MREAIITDEIDGHAEHDFYQRLRARIPTPEHSELPLGRAVADAGAMRCWPRPDSDVAVWVIPKRPGFVRIETVYAELFAAIVACDDAAVAAWLDREGYLDA